MRELELTNGHKAKLDDDDYDWLSKGTWHALTTPSGKVYACGGSKMFGNKKEVLMHRVVLAAHTPGCNMDVDHIDGDTLNNQRSNLRLATRSQNIANSKKREGTKYPYKGINYDAKKKRFRAVVTCNGVKYRSKSLKTLEEAALAYNDLISVHHGEFARFNVVV